MARAVAPWATRRGFDSLVQMSAGIAETGMHWRQSDRPVPLPVQALDHATGYFMAATAIRAVTRRLDEGFGTEARLSLARTARLLSDGGHGDPSLPLLPETAADLSPTVFRTPAGEASAALSAEACIVIRWEQEGMRKNCVFRLAQFIR